MIQMRSIYRQYRHILFLAIGLLFLRRLLIPRTLQLDCSQPLSVIEDERLLECIHRKNLKSVQMLTELFKSTDNWYGKIGRDAFDNCKETRCFAFRYKSSDQKALENSDGVVVHMPNLLYMPSRDTYKRRQRQLWSFYTFECQRLSVCLKNFELTDLDDWFNLTLTAKSNFSYYVFDAKQLHRYDEVRYWYKIFKNRKTKPIQEAKKLAIWFVSNCNTFSKREILVEEMSKYMDIDIYGRCNFSNSKTDPCKNSTDQTQCLNKLFNSYKFYLSFENNNCDSYISEKYFRFYQADSLFEIDLIPIVRGAAYSQYLERAPSNYSFIYADNFKSPKELADYILYLDRNETAYLEYFEWKRDLVRRIEAGPNNDQLLPVYLLPLCDICEKLHDENYLNSQTNSVIKITEYYNPVLDCGRDYPNQTDEELLEALRNNCFWALYHQKLNKII